MTLNPIDIRPGQEQHEYFNVPAHRCGPGIVRRVQYDYRANDGELFSTTGTTLKECRRERDRWLHTRRM